MIREIVTKPLRWAGYLVLSGLDHYRHSQSIVHWNKIEKELDTLVNDVQSQLTSEQLTDLDREWFNKMMDEDGDFVQELVEENMSGYRQARWVTVLDYVKETISSMRYTSLLLDEDSYFKFTHAAAAITQMVHMSTVGKIKALMFQHYQETQTNPEPQENEEVENELELPFFSGPPGEA